MTTTQNSTFEAIRTRRAVRAFRSKPVPQSLLLDLLSLANLAPSGYNLQPWYFVVVQDAQLKSLLKHIALDQKQVEQAPCVVAFVADPLAWKRSYPLLLERAAKTKRMHELQLALYKKTVPLLFRTGPLGLFGLAKAIALPILRLFRPTPSAICSKAEAWHYVRAQTMLAAANFMIAAKSVGLDTSPMEGFDESRAKKLLSIPSSMGIVLLIALGYEEKSPTADPRKPEESIRFSLEEKVRLDLFTQRLKRG